MDLSRLCTELGVGALFTPLLFCDLRLRSCGPVPPSGFCCSNNPVMGMTGAEGKQNHQPLPPNKSVIAGLCY